MVIIKYILVSPIDLEEMDLSIPLQMLYLYRFPSVLTCIVVSLFSKLEHNSQK